MRIHSNQHNFVNSCKCPSCKADRNARGARRLIKKRGRRADKAACSEQMDD